MGRNTFQRETGKSEERERERMLNSRLDNQTMAGDLRYKARELGTQTDRRMVRKKKGRTGERGGGGRGGSDTRFGARH